jgi:hypothetical protein
MDWKQDVERIRLMFGEIDKPEAKFIIGDHKDVYTVDIRDLTGLFNGGNHITIDDSYTDDDNDASAND